MNQGSRSSAHPGPVAGWSAGRFGFAMGNRFFGLLALSLMFVPLMFISTKFGWLMAVWNVVVFILFFIEASQLPLPGLIIIERTFIDEFRQLEESTVALSIANRSETPLLLTVQDEVPESLSDTAIHLELEVAANSEQAISYQVTPLHRGEKEFGKVYLRYESRFRLAQRWAIFNSETVVRVLPNLSNTKQRQTFARKSRQLQRQQRSIKLRGQGREFQSLRDFQTGDELRNVCWTATARRSKLVTTQRQVERSQTIWTVLDCGRLMRARVGNRSKLDYSVEAAITLAQVCQYGGDASAMLAYGERIQQRRLPGRGGPHLQSMLQQAALVYEESSEADHLLAVSTLLRLQKSRSMIVWITDLADLAITPEVISAAILAAKRHLVVVVVIGQPDVTEILSTSPADINEAFLYSAASEMTARRELAVARLRARGVRAVEVSAPHMSATVLDQYLEVKQKNLL